MVCSLRLAIELIPLTSFDVGKMRTSSSFREISTSASSLLSFSETTSPAFSTPHERTPLGPSISELKSKKEDNESRELRAMLFPQNLLCYTTGMPP